MPDQCESAIVFWQCLLICVSEPMGTYGSRVWINNVLNFVSSFLKSGWTVNIGTSTPFKLEVDSNECFVCTLCQSEPFAVTQYWAINSNLTNKLPDVTVLLQQMNLFKLNGTIRKRSIVSQNGHLRSYWNNAFLMFGLVVIFLLCAYKQVWSRIIGARCAAVKL